MTEDSSYVLRVSGLIFSCCYTATTSDLVKDLEEEDVSEEKRSNSSTSIDGSDTDEEVRSLTKEAVEVEKSLSDDTRERLCLKAEPSQSTDITLHLVAEWIN